MTRYAYKKQYAWGSSLAYFAGLMASDGCLVNNGRHLNITSKDIEVINNVQRILTMNVKVAVKLGGFGTNAYHLQFSNVALYDFLLAIGLTPAKSKTIPELLIPDEYFRDFLRGEFDGDGTVYGYWDKRWRSSLMYYTQFISASMPFLQWLQKTNTRLAGTTAGVIKPATGANVLSYAKADSQKLFNFMYYRPGLPLLSRKYDKFIAFLGADPYPSKELRADVLEW